MKLKINNYLFFVNLFSFFFFKKNIVYYYKNMAKKVKDFMKNNWLGLLILLVLLGLVIYLIVSKVIKKNDSVVVLPAEQEIPPMVRTSSEPSKKGSAECVFFHMEGCGHCKAMMPEWKKLAAEGSYKGCAFVDYESENEKIMRQHGIQGFPTIKFCPNGVNSPDSCKDYRGERTAEAIKSWLDSLL